MLRHRIVLTAFVLLVPSLAAPLAARANVPGANGAITYTYADYTTFPFRSSILAFVDPASGADARAAVDAGGTVGDDSGKLLGRLFGAPDSRHVAINSTRDVLHGLAVKSQYWQGAHVGTNDALGGMLSSGPFFPGLVVGADLCRSNARVVAALADGNLLWRRYQTRRPNCNSESNTTQQWDYTITTAGAAPIRETFTRTVSGSSNAEPLGTVFAAGADANVVYSYKTSGEVGFHRVDLSAQTTTRLSTTVPFTPTDVTPDGRYIVGHTSGDYSIRRFDTQTQEVITLVTKDAATALPPAASGTYVPLAQPVVSPDGTKVAFQRQNATDGGTTFDAVLVVGIDGSNPHVVRQLGAHHFMEGSSLNWQPAPGLDVEVAGGTLTGDLVELDLTLRNPTQTPFTAMRFDNSGHAEGVVFNTALYSPQFRAGFTMISGPAPGLASSIGAGSALEHQYLLGVDSPGNVQVRAKAYATGQTGSEIQVEETMYLVARNRDLPTGEEAMMVAGGWAEVQDALHEQTDSALKSSIAAINKTLGPRLPSSQRAAARTTTAVERELAQQAGLPDAALAWLPTDTPTAIKAYVAFRAAEYEASVNVAKRKLGSAYNFGLKVPWDYWTDQLPWGPETAVPVGTALFDEAAYWSIKGEQAGRGYAKDAYALATDPKRQHQFKQAVAQSVTDMNAKMKQIAKIAPGKARQFADQFAKDPVKAWTQVGTFFGTVRGEAGFIAAEVAFTPNKGAIARGIKNVGGRLVTFADDAADAGRSLLGMRTVAKADDTLLDAARHGMPAADQTRWQGIVRQVQAHAKKHGYDIDVELSFRPRNVHSAALGDEGAGKNMFMKGKSGTEIDLLLGMDRSGLGKLVIYKPLKPANYAKLPASLRKELDERIVDIEKARKEWLDPKSNLGRARTGKGVMLKGELTNPKTGEKIGTTNIKMRIAGYEKNGTISIKYLEHVVDGKVIVKPGKPKWVVSDYDGNAILRVGGKDLPGGALRGLVEGEVLRLQRENGAAMATSFHGFTYNGTDLPGKHYRNNFHFLLEGMTDAQAQKALDRYLRKYAVNQKDYDDLVSSYTNGDYVIRVTADAAYATQGL